MRSAENFELIESKIKNYKKLSALLESDKNRLNEVISLLKELRKDLSKTNKEKILALNNERATLKDNISSLKKQISKDYIEAETLILNGIESEYSEVYEKQLSRLYGVKVQIVVKNLGEEYDNNVCTCKNIISTKDKKQHLKVIRTIKFGLIDLDNNKVNKKAEVDVCVYDRKRAPGEIIPYKDYIVKSKGVLWVSVDV